MASATATSLMKPLPVDTFQVKTLFAPKTHFPFFFLSKPLNFTHLSLSSSPLSLFSQNIKFSPFVAQASNQEEEEAEEEEEEENDLSVEGSGDEGGFESSGDVEPYSEPSEDTKIFVANIPYDVDSENLAQLFNGAGIVETAEVIYNRDSDRSRGYGFVTMSTVAEAEKAVQMFSGYDFNGRTLIVNKYAPRGSRVERPPRVFEPSHKAYVGNLSWEVDDARLEQVFSEHGKVVNTRVVFDRETGRSRGFAFVTMSNETELNNAIAALDGQSLDGREIRVNVAENRAPKRNAYSY